MHPDLPKLRLLATTDHAATQLLQTSAAHRVRDGVSTIQYLTEKLHGRRYRREHHDATLATCARLEQIGLGRLHEPSVRHRARIQWSVHPQTLCQALRDSEFRILPQHLLTGGESPAPTESGPAPALARALSPTPALPPSEPAAAAATGTADWQRHTFHLRPGVKIQLALPTDLTLAEAERLAHLLRASVIPAPGGG